MSDIEFPLIVKKGTVYVLLDDVSLRKSYIAFLLSSFFWFFNQVIEFIDLIYHNNSISSITILSWFDNPNVFLPFK
jgi:hypothetical protein